MTAEVMVGTPVTSGSASFVDDCSFEAVAYTGVYYEDPAEYVDRYLHGYGVDRTQSVLLCFPLVTDKHNFLQRGNTGVSSARSVVRYCNKLPISSRSKA